MCKKKEKREWLSRFPERYFILKNNNIGRIVIHKVKILSRFCYLHSQEIVDSVVE